MSISTSESNFLNTDKKNTGTSNQDFIDLPLNIPDDKSKGYVGYLDILHRQLDDEEKRKLDNKPSPVESVSGDQGNPENKNDLDLEGGVVEAMNEGNFDLALDLVNKIESEEVLHRVVEKVVEQLVKEKEFSVAKKFLRTIHNMDFYNQQLSIVLENQRVYLDQGNDGSAEAVSGDDEEVANKVEIKKPEQVENKIEPDLKTEVISDDDYENFVKTGDVPGDVLVNIANRIANTGSITDRERAIYEIYGEKIEQLLRNRKGESTPDDEVLDSSINSASGLENPPEQEKIKLNPDESSSGIQDIKDATIAPAPENIPNSNEEIDANLEKARSEYANQLVIWKNSIREKKSKFRKVLQDLGVDKQLPPEEEPVELVEARRLYIEAKKAKNKDLIGVIFDVPNQSQKPLGIAVEEMNSKKEQLLSSIESENSELEKRLMENIPPLERGILGKAFDKWRAMPRYQRIAISSSLAFTAGLASGLGLGSAAVYGGMRAGRAVAGAVLSQGAGKTLDTFYGKKNRDNKDQVFENYAKQINLDNFEQKEKEMMAFLDKQKDERKRQILKKGLVMAAVAGASNLGVGGGGGTDIPDNINPTPGVSGSIGNTVENTGVTSDLMEKPEVLDAKSNLDNLVESKSPVLNESPGILETKVELSSKGFIQDMHNLKANILAEYGGEPPETLNQIMNKTPIELAKAFHFYDPETNATGLGFKGESIGLDSTGNVYYEHLDGTKQIIFDAKTGEFHHFDGEMVVKNAPDVQLYPNGKIGDDITPVNFEKNPSLEDPFSVNRSNVSFIPQDVVSQTDLPEKVNISYEEPLVTNTDLRPEEVLMNTESVLKEASVPPLRHISLDDGRFVDVVNIEGQKSVTFNDIKIGQEVDLGNKKILALDDKYQDGEQYADIRNAFARAFEKDVKADVIGPYPEALPFEGGKIYIAYNVPNDLNSVRVLLNGKEIAVGSTSIVDGSGFPKLKIHSDLKGGWLLADNAYERAFKYVNKLIKAGKIDLKI